MTGSAVLVKVETVVGMVVVIGEVNEAVVDTVFVVVMIGMPKKEEQKGDADG